MTAPPWNKDQADLMLWLAKQDTSVAGECIGPTLSALHAAGFVRIVRRTATGTATIRHGTPIADYDRVLLTADGWRRVNQIRQRLQQ